MFRRLKGTKTPKKIFLGVFLFIGLFTCFSSTLSAQLSTIHYLPPLYGRDDGILHRHFILVSNPDESRNANVLILDGAGNILFNEAVFNQATFKAFLGEGAAANGVIDTDQLNTVISSEENLIVQSDIPVYVQIRHTVSHEVQDNPDRHLHGLITSSKGDWAIGTRFRTGFGYSSNSSLENNVSPNGRSDFISVMATEDNTSVTFSDINQRVNLGGVFNTPRSFDIDLQAGQTYTIAHFPDTDNSNLSLNGTLVTGSNPIVVNCGSWALDHSPLDNPDRSQREIAAEQIIPMERLHTEYVVMNVDGVELAEKVIIVGDQDNTEYFLHGNNTPTGTLDAGEYVVLDKDRFSAQGNLYIQTSVPTPVYQTTGLQHYSVGYTIVTPLKCWGTQSTIIPRMDEDFVLEDSRINIVAPVGTNLTVSGAVVASPEPILGLPDYETYRATPLVTDDIFVTADKNVQVLTSYRSIARGAATYYSEYFQTDTMLIADRCMGETYAVGNSVYSSTGVFYDTLQNINGCDSLVMLDLTIHEPSEEIIYEEICRGESVYFEGLYYAETGTYDARLSSSFGCDSTITLDLIVHPQVYDTVQMEMCYGEMFIGSPLENDTSINIIYSSEHNCDSTVTLQVNVLDEFETNVDFTICPGDEIEIDGQFFAAEDIYQIYYTAQNGCDSVLNIEIYHFPIEPIFENREVCIGSYYNGVLINQDTTLSEFALTQDGCATELFTNVNVLQENYLEQEFIFCPGMEYNGIAVYSDSTIVEQLQNANGCDSVVVSSITMESFTSVDTVYLNSGDSYHGITYYNDDLAIEELVNMEGCDSTAFIYIFINPVLTGVVNVNLCPGESYEGNTPSADSTYTTEHTASNGFDSITVFNIYVQEVYADTLQIHICEGESTLIFGNWEEEAGLYENLLSSFYGCDSLIVAELIIDPLQEYEYDLSICEGESIFLAGAEQTEAGLYQEQYLTYQNCDSTVYINLEVLPNMESSFEYDICKYEFFDGVSLAQDSLFVEFFAAANGCDSVVYTQVNVQNPFASIDTIYVFEDEGFANDTLFVDSLVTFVGCDSIVSTQVIVVPSVSVLIEETLCEGELYNGIEIYNDTTFLETLLAANGADSFVVTQIYVNYNSSFDQEESLCYGESYLGIPLYGDTTFLDITNNALGCDSFIYTSIEVIPPVEESILIYLIEGEAYQGVFYESDTSYAENFISSFGCDSTLFTEIIIIPHVYTEEEVFVCENEFYLNHEITQDTVLVEALQSYLGSDSIHTTYVNMLDTTTTYFNYTSCEGEPIILFGVEWYENETITELVLNEEGCYDLEVRILHFNEPSGSNISQEICTGTDFFFNGEYLDLAGTYYDTLVNQFSCDSIIELQLSVSDELAIDVFGGNAYCEGESTTIFAQGYDSYLWSSGSTENELEVFEEGFYEVSIVDKNGCIGYGSITVPPPNVVSIDLDVFQPDCYEQEFGTIDIITTLNDSDYDYVLNGESLEGLDQLSSLLPGFYEIEAVDEIGCSQIETFLIENFLPPSLSIQSIESIVLGDSVQLIPNTNAVGIDSIVWTPDQYLSCNNCLYPFASPPNDYTYQLTLYTEDGCVINSNVSFKVEKNYSIYIPNAFSPNDDGINDFFTVYAGGAVEEVQSLHVYDRWGEKMFVNENFPHNEEREGWDGTFRAENMQPGVYVYYAEILLRTGELIFEKGDVTIMQ